VGSGGRTILELSRPEIVDAKGRRSQGAWRLDGDELTLNYDASSLSFPALIDPTWASFPIWFTTGMRLPRRTLLPNGKVLAMEGTIRRCQCITPAPSFMTRRRALGRRPAAWERGREIHSDAAAQRQGPRGGRIRGRKHRGALRPRDGLMDIRPAHEFRKRVITPPRLLNNGKVLVAGGWPNCVVILPPPKPTIPATGLWNTTGSMSTARITFTLTRLGAQGPGRWRANQQRLHGERRDLRSRRGHLEPGGQLDL